MIRGLTHIWSEQDNHYHHWQKSRQSKLNPKESMVPQNWEVHQQYGPGNIQSWEGKDRQGHGSVRPQAFTTKLNSLDIGHEKSKNKQQDQCYGRKWYENGLKRHQMVGAARAHSDQLQILHRIDYQYNIIAQSKYSCPNSYGALIFFMLPQLLQSILY